MFQHDASFPAVSHAFVIQKIYAKDHAFMSVVAGRGSFRLKENICTLIASDFL